MAQQAGLKHQRNVPCLQLVTRHNHPPSSTGSYLSDELHDKVHHQLGVLVEHALPQLVHEPLGEVEDVVDQDLVAAAAAERQRSIFA